MHSEIARLAKDEWIHSVNKTYGWELLELWAKLLTNGDSAETEALAIEKTENQQDDNSWLQQRKELLKYHLIKREY